MINELEYFKRDLSLTVRICCRQIRHKDHADPVQIHQGHLIISSSQILIDELGTLINNYKNLVRTLEQHLAGEPVEVFDEDEASTMTIYESCRHYFDDGEVECPLGSATPELEQWVTEHAERNQWKGEVFSRIFSGDSNQVQDSNDQGEVDMDLATESEAFAIKTQMLLSSIEMSNALQNFNQHMQQIYQLLQLEADPAHILKRLKES